MVRGGGGVSQIDLMFDLSNGSGYVCSAVTGLNCCDTMYNMKKLSKNTQQCETKVT